MTPRDYNNNTTWPPGLTPTNYKELQQLHEKYYDQGLRILGFPSNDFGNQEPKSEAEILEFVKKYGVTFPLFSKVHVSMQTQGNIF